MPRAQSCYSDFLLSHIPPGIKSILDVGCGAGKNANLLLTKGYQVDCVSPSKKLTSHARALLGDRVTIFQDRFENLNCDRRYDLLLFSESFQYIKLDRSLLLARNLLNKPGYVLISDFFKTDAPGKSSLRGGHPLSELYRHIDNNNFKIEKDIDITKQTAPNLTVVDDMLTQAALPVWNSIMAYLKSSYPLISSVLMWKYKRKIDKINEKYFSGTRNAANFEKFKSYRVLLLRNAE
jgi:SAM-dependent methyltransferase